MMIKTSVVNLSTHNQASVSVVTKHLRKDLQDLCSMAVTANKTTNNDK
jgi:hypothetical protein